MGCRAHGKPRYEVPARLLHHGQQGTVGIVSVLQYKLSRNKRHILAIRLDINPLHPVRRGRWRRRPQARREPLRGGGASNVGSLPEADGGDGEGGSEGGGRRQVLRDGGGTRGTVHRGVHSAQEGEEVVLHKEGELHCLDGREVNNINCVSNFVAAR